MKKKCKIQSLFQSAKGNGGWAKFVKVNHQQSLIYLLSSQVIPDLGYVYNSFLL